MELTSPLVIGFLASFFLLGVLAFTSFIKISVVFMITRNAMGLQQVPSNAVLMALALFLSIYISMPVFSAASSALLEADIQPTTVDQFLELWNIGIAPFQAFIIANIEGNHLGFFVEISNELWRGSGLVGTRDDIIIQVPAFIVSELTEAFELGFLLYLPFVAIDLAVTGILMALGMQMVQPNIIAVPFKLLLFVMIDGWPKLTQGLLVTYIPVG